MDIVKTPLKEKSIEELQDLKELWYKQALENEDIYKCNLVCREFGEISSQCVNRFQEKDIDICDTSGSTKVHINGKKVMDTHGNIRLFIPGPWMDRIRELAKIAQEKKDAYEEDRKEKKRLELIDELSL